MEKRLGQCQPGYRHQLGQCRGRGSTDSRITLGEQTETANDISVAVGGERGKGVALEHAPDMLDLALGLGVGLGVYPFLAGGEREIGLVSGSARAL